MASPPPARVGQNRARQPLAPLAVSITDAATLLNVSRPTVYVLIERGKLRCAKVGNGIVRIPVADIHALLGLAPEEAAS